MTRRPVKDRFDEDLGLAVRCGKCDKRLGWVKRNADGDRRRPISPMWLYDAVDATHGTIHAGSKPAALHGIKYLAHEDWLSLRCRRCGFDWQGRQGVLAALLADATTDTIRLPV